MKQYLTDTFKYNSWANLKLLEAIRQTPDFDEGVALFSHMINAQNIWLARVTKDTGGAPISWPGPVFLNDELEERWTGSTDNWLQYLEGKTEAELNEVIVFRRMADGKLFQVKIADVILQINYHSIHHRAQVQRLIREKGGVPPATDYILTRISEVSHEA